MCTVSVVAAGDRLRLMCNRDEQYVRPAAHPPAIVRTARGHALLPLDPRAGGTWVAANAHGLAFSVLNGAGDAGAPGLSRGRLILELIDTSSLAEVIDGARALCSRRWPAHRLLATDGRRVLVMRLAEAGVTVDECAVRAPLMFASSSLGDALVEPLRRGLFEQLVVAATDPLDGQDAFHRHRWPDRPHLSVHMRRHDAATQSITTVDVSPTVVAMRYESTADLAGRPAMLTIERTASAGAREVPSHDDRTARRMLVAS